MNYYTEQIITYMGNKRQIIPHIEQIINIIKKSLGKDKLTIGDANDWGKPIYDEVMKNE